MIIAALLAAVVSGPLKADGSSDARQLACYNRASNQQAMNTCARDAYGRADKALQAQWKQLLEVVREKTQETKQLKSSQRLWLAYRSAWCTAAAWENRGQGDWAQWHFGCLAELTRQRTKEVGDLLLGDGY